MNERRELERLGGIPPCPDKEWMRNTEESELRNGVAVIGISRHRLGTDAKGVTTLVAFHGCPLRCAYSGEDHPAVPAITTQFFSMGGPFALRGCNVNDYFL